MTKDILFSIIMPVYNSGSFLSVAVDSILNQNYYDFELILVDDGSTDGSSDVCDEYGSKDTRVKVIHQMNGGICRARNAALEVARGEYIGFADHDDVFEPGVFDHCAKVMYNESPDMVKFGKVIRYVDSKGATFRTDYLGFENAVYDRIAIVAQYLILRQKSLFRFVWDGFFKKQVIDKHSIEFDSVFKLGGEDHDFCNTFSMYANKIVTLGEFYYVHYIRSGFSTSSKRNPCIESMYLIEGKRLLDCLKFINYSIKDNLAIYANQVFESIVLPIIRYHLRNRTLSTKEIIETIRSIRENDFFFDELDSLSLKALCAQSLKLGPFSYAFFRGKYGALLTMIKFRYYLMK